MKKIIGTIRNKYEVIKEILLFIPTLYKVRTWDYSSLFFIMEHWLIRMRECHEKDKWHYDNKKRVKELTTTINILNRLSNNNYTDKFLEEHDKRWGESTHSFFPTDNTNKYFTMITNREKVITEEDKLLEKKEYLKILDHEYYLWKQDMDYLFRMFKKHIRGWWV